MRQRNRRTKRGASRRATAQLPFSYEDIATARVAAGAGTSWNVPGGIPQGRVYRPSYVLASVVASGPAICQLSIHDPTGNAVAYTPPTPVGTVPVQLRVAYPSTSANFPPSTSSSQSILLSSFENVCVDVDPTLRHSVLVVLRVVLRFGHEQIVKACPKFSAGHWGSDEGDDSSYSVMGFSPLPLGTAPPCGI